MAHFTEAAVTDAGNELLNEMMAGRYVEVTKAAGGTGTVQEDQLHAQTDLQQKKQDLSVIDDVVDKQGRTIAIQIGNAEESYKLEQIGVFGRLRDGDEEEKLLFILQDRDPISVPDNTAPTFMLNIYTHLNINNVGRFIVTVDKTGIVNIEFLEKKMQQHNEAEDAHQDIRKELAALEEDTASEIGTVTITNTQPYPFPLDPETVNLQTQRKTLDYTVVTEISKATGNVQAIEVYDKQLNGFKIKIDGSATSATITYYVSGGMKA